MSGQYDRPKAEKLLEMGSHLDVLKQYNPHGDECHGEVFGPLISAAQNHKAQRHD
jgi:hypothetical protein